MLKQYETVFIMTPVLSEEQMKETVEEYQKFLVSKGAEVVFEDHWGLRKLAYPIQKKSTGFYTLLQFDVVPSVIATLETQFRRDERVLRFLTFRLDKYAYEYAEKRKRNRAQSKADTEVKTAKAEEVKEETKEEKED